jgi:hypothetical protein
VTKLRESRWESQEEEEQAEEKATMEEEAKDKKGKRKSLGESLEKIAPYYVQSTSDKALGESKKKKKKKRISKRKSLG